jgi:two-component system, OmpR family, response regulator NblR
MSVAPSPCILLVEADSVYAQHIRLDLEEAGYTVAIAPDTSIGLHEANTRQPALIVIDRMLVGESGLSLSSQLRRSGVCTPILMLMARDSIDDRVACLESGADDYFLKPYRAEEFLKWIRLYLHPETGPSEQIRFGELILDLSTRKVLRNGRSIDLTMKEYELLKYFMEHPREVLTREQILENVWGYDFMGESNVIEVYIRYLRLKIEDEGEKRLIQTVRGIGYVLREA